ncbi:MAG: hypothetical protein LBP87_09245 [Planctomycetaceae bacterium]|jgi:hypothetical protein|nr:hypothetical protein [Planctomycetaceae bacterium]
MTKQKKLIILLSLSGILLCFGCNRNVPLSGTVTFPDGSPLECGIVIFEKDGKQAKGTIGKEGFYVVGSLKDNDGIPKGEYRVCIRGAVIVGKKTPDGKIVRASGMFSDVEQLIAKKYEQFETSGLTIIADGKNKIFNIQVERP